MCMLRCRRLPLITVSGQWWKLILDIHVSCYADSSIICNMVTNLPSLLDEKYPFECNETDKFCQPAAWLLLLI